MGNPRPSPDWNRIANSVRDVCFHRWGGPRSPLAVGYLEQTMLPDILWFLHRLEPWWHTVLAQELLKDKFVIQHGFPNVLGQGMAEEILVEISPWQTEQGEEKDLLFLLLSPIALDQPMHYLTETFPLPEEIWAKFKMAWRQQYNFLTRWQPQILDFIRLWQDNKDFQLTWQFRTELWLVGINSNWDFYLSQLMQLEKCRIGLLNSREDSYDLDLIPSNWLNLKADGQVELNKTGSKIITPWIVEDIINTVEDRMLLGGPTHGINSAMGVLARLYPEQIKYLLDLIVDRNRQGWLPLLESWYARADKEIKIYLIDAIGHLGKQKALPFLITALQADDASIILAICETLAMIGDRSCGFALSALLKNGSYIVQEKVVYTLAELKFTPALKSFQKMLNDPNVSPELKRTIKRAIHIINTPSSS